MAKEIYSFYVTRKWKEPVSENSKKMVPKSEKVRVVLLKPTAEQSEDLDFFYGQQFNKFLNAGFLSRAMLSKKIGDVGGFNSEIIKDEMKQMLAEYLEATNYIAAFENASDLSTEQEEKLKKAKETFAYVQKVLTEYEQNVRNQFNETAESRAEREFIKWFVFFCAYYEEEAGDNKTLVPLFEGGSYKEKRATYLLFSDDDWETQLSTDQKRVREIAFESFNTLTTACVLWQNDNSIKPEEITKLIKLSDGDTSN